MLCLHVGSSIQDTCWENAWEQAKNDSHAPHAKMSHEYPKKSRPDKGECCILMNARIDSGELITNV